MKLTCVFYALQVIEEIGVLLRLISSEEAKEGHTSQMDRRSLKVSIDVIPLGNPSARLIFDGIFSRSKQLISWPPIARFRCRSTRVLSWLCGQVCLQWFSNE